MNLLRRTMPSLALVALVTLASRFAALPGAHEAGMTPDAARLLNDARAVGRGEGFVTPEAFPAWLAPRRLPAPETLKEPGYPYAIALISPLARDPFRAGQWISLLAGTGLPFVAYALVRALVADAAAATLAGLFTAASPILILQSVYVMAESLFALALLSAFLFAERARPPKGVASMPAGWACGAMLGLAILVRAQAFVAVPALAWRLWPSRRRPGWRPLGFAASACLLVLAPYIARNVRLFHAPFHVESRLVALTPYMDPLTLTTSPDPPPAFLDWARQHPRDVLAQVAAGARRVVAHAVPGFMLGSRLWLLPLAVGLVAALRDSGRWGPLLLYQFLTLALVLPINWPDRYLASVAPLFAAQAALGTAVVLRRLEDAGSPGRVVSMTLIGVLLFGFTLQVERTRRGVPNEYHPEIEAARDYGPWLRARLAPGEALMAETTSYWAWYADRPAAHLVIADEARVREALVRLRVRWAALPARALPDLAARYPERRLPRCFEPVLEDRARDVALFRVRLDGPAKASSAPRTQVPRARQSVSPGTGSPPAGKSRRNRAVTS